MEIISIVKGLILAGEVDLASRMLADMIRTEIGLEEINMYVESLSECKKVG